MIGLVDNLYWREPLWLLVMGLPLLMIVIRLLLQRRQWARVAPPELQPWLKVSRHPERDHSRRWRRGLLLISWLLLCMAMAGPRTPQQLPAGSELPRAAIMLVLDRSRSMEVRDGRPDRVRAAQRMIESWLSDSKQIDWGLIQFAGHAHLLSLTTADTGFIRERIGELHRLPLPTLGNALAPALSLAAESLAGQSEDIRAVVVFSDGDVGDQARIEAQTVVGEWRQYGDVQLHFVGVGGERPLPIPDGEQGWMRFDDQAVLSRRDADVLQSLAARAGGEYRDLETLESLNDLIDFDAARLSDAVLRQVIWREWFAVPLLLAVFVAGLALIRRQQIVQPLLIVFAVGSLSTEGRTDDAEALAQQVLEQGQWQQAAERYGALKGYPARFAEGVACYRLEDWACAAQAWSAAALIAEDAGQRSRAVFNLGNLRFRLAQYDEAEVLFEDALGLIDSFGPVRGMERSQVETNLAYARELRRAVEEALDDQQETLRRAAFRARATGEDIDSAAPSASAGFVRAQELIGTGRYKAGQLQTLVQQGMARLRSQGSIDETPAGQEFVRTETTSESRDTALALWKRRLEMETGAVAPLRQPQLIDGVRPW